MNATRLPPPFALSALSLLLGLAPRAVQAQVAPNVIAPDGRTATQVKVEGTRSDITTGTVKGSNAFNSFTRFEVGRGQTVNVHTPAEAQRVINLVTGAPVQVDGVLNGIREGRIGGHLVFADPHGMVVGKDGVVNAARLTVSTPTRAHMDAMLDGSGRIGEAAVQQMLDGRAPREPGAEVRVDGHINATEAVRVEAARVVINGRIAAGADARHDARFRAAVNANGLVGATGLVDRGGVIELVADEKLVIQGSLAAIDLPAAADAAAPEAAARGGTIQLAAPTIELGATAELDASGARGGGDILIGRLTAAPAPVRLLWVQGTDEDDPKRLAPVDPTAGQPVPGDGPARLSSQSADDTLPLTTRTRVEAGARVSADATASTTSASRARAVAATPARAASSRCSAGAACAWTAASTRWRRRAPAAISTSTPTGWPSSMAPRRPIAAPTP
jgi:filamentous hemagglutinin family protein